MSSAPDSEPLVVLEAIRRTFPGPPEVSALRDASLSLHRGEFLAVQGPSGSGKSTLLNILGLLDRPSSGYYSLDGRDVSDLSERDRDLTRSRSVGFVFQAFHLISRRTALGNVELALLHAGIPRQERRQRALESLERVGIGHKAASLPATLSGGERQRVAIARALAKEPRLILCDEPTGNLDSGTTQALMDTLASLRGQGVALVVITHDPLVTTRAERVLVLQDGILAEGHGADRPPRCS